MTDFEPLYTADEMRAAEAGYPGYPGTVGELMERAGCEAARVALELHPGAQRWTVVCGGGSNGGDGRIAARELERAGKDVRVVDAKAGETDLGEPDVIVDALFGTGFSGEPRAEAAALIERMNGAGARVLAIDVPSGVDASTGEVAGAGRPRRRDGHVPRAQARARRRARPLPRRRRPRRATSASSARTPARASSAPDLLDSVPRRGDRDNKYTAGHLLVVGGSRGLTGAPSLAALAAMRADAGYVTVAVPESTLPVFEQRLLEAVKRPLPDAGGIVGEGAAEVVLELAQRASAVALGPGLGRGDGPRALVRRVLAELAKPVVVDADALFELEPGEWPAPRVLTPHEGELARLLGRESKEVAAHRLASRARRRSSASAASSS